MTLINLIPETTNRWVLAAGRFEAVEETSCEICLTTTIVHKDVDDMVRLSRISDRGNIANAVVDGALPTHVGGLSELLTAAKAELEKLA